MTMRRHGRDRDRDRDPLYQKKSMGQVFLNTDWPVLRMVERLVDLKIDRALEIGPGPGILTRGLMAAGIHVTAVEKDDRFAARLLEASTAWPDAAKGKLEVENADILHYDLGAWIERGGGRAALVGNIPYNISSPIMIKGLEHLENLIAILFMTQLEFACRVAARPNTKDFGSLSVFAQLRAETNIEFKVERSCFTPIPKVDSAVMLCVPRRDKLDTETLQIVEKITRAAFTQRRKKLRNSVRSFLDLRGGEEGCPIDLERRADALSPREFVILAKFLKNEPV